MRKEWEREVSYLNTLMMIHLLKKVIGIYIYSAFCDFRYNLNFFTGSKKRKTIQLDAETIELVITYGNVSDEDDARQYLFQSVLHVMILVYSVCLLQDGIMLVYDVTNQKSFDTITSSKWLQPVSVSTISHSSHIFISIL